MIKVEKIENELHCRIEGNTSELSSDISTIFKVFSKHPTTEHVLLSCINDFIESRAEEILNKKENK